MGLAVSAATAPVLGNPGSSGPRGQARAPVIPEMPGAFVQTHWGVEMMPGSGTQPAGFATEQMLPNQH